MPIFEFRCVECGHIFEKIFKSSDEEIALECPECECHSVDRVLSKASYVLGPGPGGNKPTISTESCGSGNQCMTVDIPGPAK